MTVRVVTDSAADIPVDLAKQRGITVVPLTIRFGDESYLSGVELSPSEFWEKLKTSPDAPATAAPSAGDFQKAFEDLLAEGADGIVSVHLSSKLSATYQSAVVAAEAVREGIGADKVKVVDSLAVSAGTGLLAVHAAERAAAGAGADEIANDLTARRDDVRLYGAIDTLEYLRRGGRIGGAQALLGTMLKFKPVISLEDGVVEPVTRVRTRPKALEHIVEIVRKDAGRIERFVVVNGDATDVDKFTAMLAESVTEPDVWPFGPIVGAHGGPGLIGVAYLLKA